MRPEWLEDSHLAVLFADGTGPQALAAWANAWAQGHISAWLAALWSGSLARTFFKSASCDAVRPILHGEALLKFAFGTCAKGCG